VAVINAGLVYLKKGGRMMSEEEIIKNVFTANLKPELMRDFILKKGDKVTTLKEVKQILHMIDCVNAHMKQATEKLLKIKVKDSKSEKKEEEEAPEKEKGGANMCRLKIHDHAWSKCPNNPISNNFSGKLDTEISASERYQNNFTKKAEKIANAEKETKKSLARMGIAILFQRHLTSQSLLIWIMNPMVKMTSTKIKKSTASTMFLVGQQATLRSWGRISYAVLSSFINLNIG
jgi:hypothetical protein